MYPFGLKKKQLRADVDYLLAKEQYEKDLAKWKRYGKKYQKENLRPIPPIRYEIVWSIW